MDIPSCTHHSNTSHVIVYLFQFPNGCPGFGIQIHLMLLFICTRISTKHTQEPYLNTSHVIVYPGRHIWAGIA